MLHVILILAARIILAPYAIDGAHTVNTGGLQGGSPFTGEVIQLDSLRPLQPSYVALQGSTPDLQPALGYKAYDEWHVVLQ